MHMRVLTSEIQPRTHRVYGSKVMEYNSLRCFSGECDYNDCIPHN
ncbi:unnamed protein product [Phytomonas sp. EM1]|nr:unnamed protein product [Phytomonas sp. EM1]|eukprot:CCW60278.1 unnamed protein product [Phytomonas sp. isolate EM1]